MGAGRRTATVLLAAALACSGCAESDPSPPPEVAEAVRDVAAYWEQALPGGLEAAAAVVIADGDRDTECGRAKEEEGSFFCGADNTIYLQRVDLDDAADRPERLREAARVYLVAHEYSHAVQVDLGVDEGDAAPGAGGASVRYELQADCLAGAYVVSRDDAKDLAPYLAVVREGGDDVGEDPLPAAQYEHGTAAQRVAAFQKGARTGPQACDLPR